MEPQQILLPFLLLLSFFIHFSTVSSQAPAPAPPGPTNITAILAKAGQFNTLIRLLQSTQLANQINTQLNNSNQGLTVFAPTDNAFSNLKAGTLNSLTDQEKVELMQFHVVPTFLSINQFQTVSNPLRTQAGSSDSGGFPLNVTTSGNQVNITTGIVNATVSNSIYSDNQLAVYQVDQVLLPLQLFGTPAPAAAPTPAPSKPKKSGKPTDDSVVDADAKNPDSSDAIGSSMIQVALMSKVSFAVSAVAFYVVTMR
ncbi:hypothetical protein Nepgr_011922 [Nepenthes gracilis]|uniref:FAS1 domain-containing protein n=1 Tax=Nepenthes gracilis TaxID=150966 RepID=A0AAD3XMS8_NEPGR|nr:hypothetical protein Nepgr_011922 [Nepenthes gracilis]